MTVTRLFPAASLALLLVAGCAAPSQSVGSASQSLSEQARANAEFEQAHDPPVNLDTRFAAGQLAEAQGMPAIAIDQYNAALKLDPKHQPSMFRLGIVYTQSRQFPKAVATWRKYIELTRNSATGYGNLAFCYDLSGKPADAEATYKKGIELEPTNKSCRTNYGLFLARGGRIDEAVAQFSAVLPPPAVHYNLASVYEMQDKKDLAKAEYNKALELDPKFSAARTRLSRIE